MSGAPQTSAVPMTPIEAWPPRKRSGFSTHATLALGGDPDDPLLVAERVAARVDSGRIATESVAMIDRGTPVGEVIAWQARALAEAQRSRWERLCRDFEAVIGALQFGGKECLPFLRAARIARDRASEAAHG